MTPQILVGFQFKVIWFDADVIQLCVSAWNGAFGGTADIYEGIGNLEVAAESLRGFPRNPSDRREIILGTFDPNYAGGGVKMRFHCVDGAGHAYVEASIDSKYKFGDTVQTALLSMRVEAAAIDVFIQELRMVGKNRAGAAHLRGME